MAKMIRIASAGLLIMFILAGFVWGQGKLFDKLDKNKDGRLDLKEINEAAETLFKQYDRNGDGSLSASEFYKIKDAKSSFESLDTGKDGKINAEELKRAAEKRFRQCDKNGDGYLDEAELDACVSRGAQEGSPAWEQERTDRVRIFDRTERWSLQKQEQAIRDIHMDPVDPKYKPELAPMVSVFF